jgi:replication-associated recombination protein RarA
MNTKNGYDLYELLSALQKDIRRGNEEGAVIWAINLEQFSPTLIWKRLKVIASEDIGPGDNSIPILLDILSRSAQEMPNESDLLIIHAVVAMCRANKTRVTAEWSQIYYPSISLGECKPPIPDYAFDMHTRKGKAMGRGVDFFYDESSIVYPEIGVNDERKARAREATKKYREWWYAHAAIVKKRQANKGQMTLASDELDVDVG